MEIVFNKDHRDNWWNSERFSVIFLCLCVRNLEDIFPEISKANKIKLTMTTDPTDSCVELTIGKDDSIYYKHYRDSVVKRFFTRKHKVENTEKQYNTLYQFLKDNNCQCAYLSSEVLK